MMSQHGRLVNVKSSSSCRFTPQMTTSHVKAIQQQQQRISIFFIFKGEDKVNVNVIVYTKVSGLLKVNTGEDLREEDFFADPCH